MLTNIWGDKRWPTGVFGKIKKLSKESMGDKCWPSWRHTCWPTYVSLEKSISFWKHHGGQMLTGMRRDRCWPKRLQFCSNRKFVVRKHMVTNADQHVRETSADRHVFFGSKQDVVKKHWGRCWPTWGEWMLTCRCFWKTNLSYAENTAWGTNAGQHVGGQMLNNMFSWKKNSWQMGAHADQHAGGQALTNIWLWKATTLGKKHGGDNCWQTCGDRCLIRKSVTYKWRLMLTNIWWDRWRPTFVFWESNPIKTKTIMGVNADQHVCGVGDKRWPTCTLVEKHQLIYGFMKNNMGDKCRPTCGGQILIDRLFWKMFLSKDTWKTKKMHPNMWWTNAVQQVFLQA